MNLLTTLRGSLMETFLPAGWDLEKIDRLGSLANAEALKRRPWWNPHFEPVGCASLSDFDTFMGHEIAREIQVSAQQNRPLLLILPVGPMGMYRWAVYFLKEWNISCAHVHGFNMDEWSDPEGNTLPRDNTGAFQYAMEQAFYGPLGTATVPKPQRHFALKGELPSYAEQIEALKKQGARLVMVFGGYAIYFPELYPTRLRSTGTGFCYSVARYLAAMAPFILGSLVSVIPSSWTLLSSLGSADDAFRYAALLVSSVFVVGIAVLPFIPETKGKPLPE